MGKYPAAGISYIELDDPGGTPRDLSPYVDEIGLLGLETSFLDVTGLNDAAQRVIPSLRPAQELVLRGAFDDAASTGPDAVLAGLVGQTGTVSYGPAGNGAGQRRLTGEFLCLSYRISSKVGQQVRFEARFMQDGPVTDDTW